MKDQIKELIEEVKQLKNMIFILSAKVEKSNGLPHPVYPTYPDPYFPRTPCERYPLPLEIWYGTSVSDRIDE